MLDHCAGASPAFNLMEVMLGRENLKEALKRVEENQGAGGVDGMRVEELRGYLKQAMLQDLQRDWDQTFSAHSYGFRPGRTAHQAIAQAPEYINAGYRMVVDIDLEKFFDRVKHDVLMSRVARRVNRQAGAETATCLAEQRRVGEWIG